MIQQQGEQKNRYFQRIPQVDANLLKIRLDTSDLLEKIEYYLRGARSVYTKDDKGRIVQQKIQDGVAKANEEGVQGFLNWISATINPQVVQGNFPATSSGDSPAFNRYIMEYHIELTELVYRNIYRWNVNDTEASGIISFIMLLVQPFFSRLIANLERESYSTSLKGEQSMTTEKKGGLFGF